MWLSMQRAERSTPRPPGGTCRRIQKIALSTLLSARGDVDRLAENEVRRHFDDLYEGLPGARGGLTAATIGAGTATAFFAVMGTLWFVLPAVLAVVFTVVFFWVGGSRRSSTHRRVMRTRG